LTASGLPNQLAPGLNPDSAVPADAMSEEQTFRSEVNGSLPERTSIIGSSRWNL